MLFLFLFRLLIFLFFLSFPPFLFLFLLTFIYFLFFLLFPLPLPLPHHLSRRANSSSSPILSRQLFCLSMSVFLSLLSFFFSFYLCLSISVFLSMLFYPVITLTCTVCLLSYLLNYL